MGKTRKFLLKNESVFTSIFAVILAIFAIAILLLASDRNPIEAFGYFMRGAFGNLFNFADTVSRIIPLLIAAIAFIIGAKSSVFNVGIEGQLLLGALASAVVGFGLDLPKIIHLPLMLLTGTLAGGLYALIPAWLKVYRKVNEILSTIMLNYPAFFFNHYIVLNVTPLEGVIPATPFIKDSAKFVNIFAGTRLHAGIIVTVLVVALAYFFLQKTSLGYEMRAVGLNREAARFHGVPVEKRMMLAFFMSGCLAGLAGAVEVAGVHYRYLDQFSPGYGYDSITVAMVGLMNPIGAIFSATLFGALKTGIMDMAVYTEIPRQLVDLINGIMVLFVSAKSLIRAKFMKMVKGKTPEALEEETV
ncbi:MAG: ABC transporter permease [Anaerolineaceae bacterium]|nr:ABC transporter permease [Anaerolineaceae bacterium]